jgi:hypothetical protein
MYSSSTPGRPVQTRPKSGSMGRALAAKLPPWGWLEWFLLSQSLIPALLFVPGASVLRLFTRIAAFVIALVAWFTIWQSGRRPPSGPGFPAAPWLLACAGWLGVMLFHPNGNSPLSVLAQAAMYLTVMSPAFWAPRTVVSSRQIVRIMLIIFVCSALNTLVGIGQVYRPETFNPPAIPAIDGGNDFAISSLTYVTGDGRRIVRPCGLSDNPGQAAGAGSAACLIGLCLAVRPISAFKRLICLAMAFAGMAVIYFCQARAPMVMLFVCVVGLVVLFVMRGYSRQAMLLGVGSVVMLFSAAVWVVSAVGDVGTKRFMSLVEERPDELYGRARGGFVQETFDTLIWQSPLGSGLGRWGQAYSYFGDTAAGYSGDRGQVWVEVQWPGWVVDGGIPLMVMYVVAIALAMLDTLRIARTSKDTELAYWASVIFTLNLSIVAGTFSACPFVAPYGIGFWAMAAAVHAADLRVREQTAQRRPAPGPRLRPA